MGCLQMVAVVDAELANQVLGSGESLSKALEPHLSDLLTSNGAHHSIYTAGTKSPYWQLVRKGMAPAFAPRNIKCVSASPQPEPSSAAEVLDASNHLAACTVCTP